MTFLQPFVLFGLPLVAVPIIIHLLNRVRYRSRAWAAMSFLVAATRRSRRHARLRHWLVLLCRVLGVLALIFAAARPLAGGWLGWALRGAPDTVVLLLDRSPSMALRGPQQPETKHDLALTRLVAAAGELGGTAQVILIDSASLVPQDIAGLDVLPVLNATQPTDAAADIPQLLAAAVEVLVNRQAGRGEIWLASDLQTSNWHPDSPRWTEIMSQLGELPPGIQVRLLALSSPAIGNVAVRIHDLQQVTVDGRRQLELVVDIERATADNAGLEASLSFPISVVMGGIRRSLPVRLERQALRFHHRLDLDEDSPHRWGFLELPADTNLRDNRAYFVVNPPQRRRALVVSEDAGVGRLLQLAAAPSPALADLSATGLDAAGFAQADLSEVSLVIWQGAPPAPTAGERLSEFLDQGGVVLAFPPLTVAAPDRAGTWSWSDRDDAPDPDRPYRVTTWEDRDGLLARTSDGTPLPVNELKILAQRPPRGDWQPVASYADGTLFLGRRSVGRGQLYACGTLPRDDWSDLGDGLVLVPMIQRALRDGAGRLQSATSRDCGDATAMAMTSAEEPWQRVDAAPGGRWTAGVYQSGARWLALNRPLAEDAPEQLDEAEVRALFGSVPLRFFEETAAATSRFQSEIWRMCLVAMLLFLFAEALLALPPVRRERAVT